MCCGRNRAAARAAVLAGAGSDAEVRFTSAIGAIMFEHVGAGAANVRGPVSGRVYRFARPGDRQRVDARDRPGLSLIPTLRLVR